MSLFSFSNFPKALQPFSVAIVRTEFNEELVDKLADVTIKGLKKCSVSAEAMEVFTVPGALEIPFSVKRIMDTGDFDGIIALGVVIQGETRHFEIVTNESARGVMELNLEGTIPIINGILAVNNPEQAIERLEKGYDFSSSLTQMMNMNEELGKNS